MVFWQRRGWRRRAGNEGEREGAAERPNKMIDARWRRAGSATMKWTDVGKEGRKEGRRRIYSVPIREDGKTFVKVDEKRGGKAKKGKRGKR